MKKKNMRKIGLLAVLVSFAWTVMAQESNNGKQLWAKSYLNQKAPEFHVDKWLTDEPDMEGKFVLVEFWGPSCAPCRKSIPELNKWSKQFKDDLVVIGISPNKEKSVRAMKEPVIEYYSALDTTKTYYSKYEVSAVPHAVLIDPEGIVRWEGFPYVKGHELTAEKIAELIKKYGRKKSAPAAAQALTDGKEAVTGRWCPAAPEEEKSTDENEKQ